MIHPRLRLIAMAAALAGLGLGLGDAAGAAPAASAAARTDQLVRPDFRRLLGPPPKAPYRPAPWRRGTGRPPAPNWRKGPAPPPFAAFDTLTVDCAEPGQGPTPLNDALYSLADYGVLHIRARGGVCAETLEINRPVTIVGEAVSTFAPGPDPAPARLAPRPGQPCIRVGPGVKGVEIRDLIIEANQAGRSACVESLDADVALVRVSLTYAGDASAVFVSGGALIVRESSIEARTNDAAVLVDAATVDFDRVRVSADVRGLDITPRPGQSRLLQVGVLAQGGGPSPGSTGVTVRDLRSGGGKLLIANSVIRGWANGVYADRGARVDISRTRILHALRGVTSASAQVSLRESAVWAEDYGGLFSGGEPTVEFNRFIGAANGLTIERVAAARTQPNYVYSPRPCPPVFGPAPASYCMPMNAAPPGIGDESGFEAQGRYGWEQDGYDRGYLRDGAPRAFAAEPDRRRRRGR